MPCSRKTKMKVMARVRREYPNYGLKRRKRIVGSILYRKKRKR
jgi:hypothetical protein